MTRFLSRWLTHLQHESPPQSKHDVQHQRIELLDTATAIPDINASPLPQSPEPTQRHLRSSTVPSSRIGRLFHYGGLAASMSYGAASEILRRSTTSSDGDVANTGSVMMTEANIKRLVAKLSQMRGAALKLGQFMSIQDTHLLPPEVDKIFRRVQDSAHYMPEWQMERVLAATLGPSPFTTHFSSFTKTPFAAASIGQVHSAVLRASSSPTGKEERVAVKVQFPDIRKSIESDLGYVGMLLSMGGVLPKGLFLDRTIQVMKGELADECSYTREASYLTKFGSPSFLGSDARFKVPWVWEGSTDTVLVMQYVDGVSVGEGSVGTLSQADRDVIASRIVELCLKELFEFRVMQTDPNWTNFLWNPKTRQIELVDFGATREYSKEFMDNWLHLLQAGVAGDRNACIEWSLKLGYLTGEENDVMLDAHVTSMILLTTPFKAETPVAFGPGTAWADTTAQIRTLIPVMLKHRLTPPPKETYSLNRKLSGAFLLASRLGARVDAKKLWDNVVGEYQFGP
ncbi:ABC1-domain-containing protein [Athelia psychrophila]|uniref:ABC1-domain-containing protein n=1 Tax=Athelia psychrophila TaxID=1759441 RepID=A0A166R660_9AGAM|nr:ABC1-domain-containing protein [Fibularhizoctonia sp. CBS 109695]